MTVDEFFKETVNWKKELAALRSVLRKTRLEEDFKWNLPCYGIDGKNVAIIQPFKASLALMFFKGALLKDPNGVLKSQGPNSKASRRFEFHSVDEIRKLAPAIRACCEEGIAIERAGKKVPKTQKNLPVPEELALAFRKSPKLRKAFRALTPGRQRAYLYFFSGAKLSATRTARIEKHIPAILKGKGLTD